MADKQGVALEEFEGLILDIVRRIVDNPQEVRASASTMKFQSDRVVIELDTNKQDVGKVIGARGCTIQAIRILISALAGKHGVVADLSYAADDGRHGRPRDQWRDWGGGREQPRRRS